jgi:hypothetical protein
LKGVSQPIRSIILIVPDNYRGLLLLQLNDPNGVTVPTVNDNATVTFPSSGTVVATSDLGWSEWHNTYLRYSNGTSIPIIEADDSKVVGVVGRVGTRAGPHDQVYIVVGDAQDLVTYDPRKIPNLVQVLEFGVPAGFEAPHHFGP